MEEQNRSRQDEMREDGEISKFQAEINEEMYGFMTEFKEEFAQFRAQHNEQMADIRSKLHTIKDLLHDMMKGVGLEPPLDRVNSNPDGPTLEYSEYSASTIDARYDEMLELNRALDSEENGDYDSSGEEITTKQSLGQLDLGDEASNMLDGLNKQQPSLKLRSVGVAHHLFGDVPRPLLFEQSDRNAGLKSFPGKFYSNSMIEKVELSSPKAEIQLDGKVQQPFSFKHEVAKVVYKVFDEMPKLSLVDPNEESYANKDSITLIDCVPLALDSANGLSCHLFDPGGGHLPQTASQATLIYKYGRNDESSMPDNLCVCIVEGGLNEACKPLMQLQVDCLSWTQKALDSDDVELVRMQFCSLLNKVQPTIMSATYQYNGNVGNFLVAMEKMIVKGWIGEISMFEFDPGGCSRPYMGCGSLEYNNEQEDSKVLHKRDIDGSSCVELIAASCGITLQNGESEDSCGGIVDETLGGSVMLLVYFFDTDVYAYFNWVKVAQLLLFDTSEIDEPGVHILSESQQKGDVQFMIKIREMFTQLNLVLMLNDRIQCVSRLESALTKAEDHLSKLPPDTPYSEFGYVLQELGFERGWGDTASRVLEMMHLLSNRGIKRKPIYAVHSYLG